MTSSKPVASNTGLSISLYVPFSHLYTGLTSKLTTWFENRRHPLPILNISEHYMRNSLRRGGDKSPSSPFLLTFSYSS